MALPVIPEDEADLTPYLQEGAESSLLLCGLLTIGQTEYAPFILFPTEESISAGPKAKTLWLENDDQYAFQHIPTICYHWWSTDLHLQPRECGHEPTGPSGSWQQ